MKQLPEIKKRIKNFLESEEGKISKEKFITTGLLISAIAASQTVKAVDCPNSAPQNCADASAHYNKLELNYNQNTNVADGVHDHCVETHAHHCSY